MTVFVLCLNHKAAIQKFDTACAHTYKAMKTHESTVCLFCACYMGFVHGLIHSYGCPCVMPLN